MPLGANFLTSQVLYRAAQDMLGEHRSERVSLVQYKNSCTTLIEAGTIRFVLPTKRHLHSSVSGLLQATASRPHLWGGIKA